MRRQVILILTLILMAVLAGTSIHAGERMAVAVPLANIRSGPETDSKALWQVQRYHPFEIIQKQKDWCQFKDFEGDVAWISCNLLERINTVVTIKANCNIRKGPGTNYPVAFMAEKGVAFKVIEDKNKWLKVEHADGDQGWIYRDLVW